MKPLLRTSLILFAFGFSSLLGSLTIPDTAQGSVNSYVRKYRTITVSNKQREKLSRYNYLVEHFSSFSYFRPNHKVNPDFIRALILAESDGDAKARSKKDARGLTQIIYSTGKEAANELAQIDTDFHHVSRRRLRELAPHDLYDPAINILLACYLISKYNHTFHGKLDLVVSAWNAGVNSIVNNKPPRYKETHNLIGKVNGYFVYFLHQKKKKLKLASSS